MSKRRIRALLLCALMLCSTILMCACKDDASDPAVTESSEEEYSVTLVDGAGKPYTEKLIVKFVQGDTQIAMIPIDANGVAKKTMPKGEYSVEIMSTDAKAKYYYDEAQAKLTAEGPQIQVVLAMEQGDRSETISAASIVSGEHQSYDAYYVGAGTTHVSLDSKERNYFLFAPTEPGTYEFSVVDDAANVGIYGASIHFVLPNSTYEVVDNKIVLSVQPSMIGSGETGTTAFVIGLDAKDATACLLNVIRTGDAAWSYDEEPWTNYQLSGELQPYSLPDGIRLKEFDLTATTGTYGLVYNDADGYYHLNAVDGPLVFVQLGRAVRGISLMGMVGEIVYQNGVLMQTGSAPFRYGYNNGKDDFFKEDYTDVMRQYVTNRDKASGVRPLDKDLHYLLPLGIKQIGWCIPGTMNYLLGDLEDVNPDIAWFFLLMHEDAPIPPLDLSGCEHTYVLTDEVAATCTENGSKTYTCSLCQAVKTEEVEPLGHSLTGNVCDTCGKDLSGECIHEYQLTSEQAATCTEKGSKTYTCSKCGDTDVKQVDATGHSYADATCIYPKTCNGCGKTKGAPLGHSVDDDSDCTRCSGHIESVGGTLEFEVSIDAGKMVYYDVYRVSGTTLTIKSKDAFVVYKGNKYEANNGVVMIPELVSEGFNDPVQLAIGNNGKNEIDIKVVMTYPAGSQSNPIDLPVGALTTKTEEGNEQGVYYLYTATEDGVLSIKLNSVSDGLDAAISMTNQSTSKQSVLGEDGSDTVSIEVKAGDQVEIVIGVLDPEYQYPAATIKTTVTKS